VMGAGLNLWLGWTSVLGGVLSGAIIGLLFHREDWLGGYNSFPRRLVRLGHISFFGLGILNILFALSAGTLRLSGSYLQVSSAAFVVALVTMPVCCFLTAWRKPLRHLFPVPVGAAAIGVIALLIGAS